MDLSNRRRSLTRSGKNLSSLIRIVSKNDTLLLVIYTALECDKEFEKLAEVGVKVRTEDDIVMKDQS